MRDWQEALTAQVASNIEHYRTTRGLSRTALAQRCTELGLPTKRPALTALLDGRRQTVTLQELVVIAEALQTSIAELILPLHTGGPAVAGPSGAADVMAVAEQLFASTFEGSRGHEPYAPFARLRQAMRQFERSNRALAVLSHAIATGTTHPNDADGRPHPASEVLAAEAAQSRLFDVVAALSAAGLNLPATGPRWGLLSNRSHPTELPVLENLADQGRDLLPLFVYRTHSNQLPSARLITETFEPAGAEPGRL